jgi:hypothetical protein
MFTIVFSGSGWSFPIRGLEDFSQQKFFSFSPTSGFCRSSSSVDGTALCRFFCRTLAFKPLQLLLKATPFFGQLFMN